VLRWQFVAHRRWRSESRPGGHRRAGRDPAVPAGLGIGQYRAVRRELPWLLAINGVAAVALVVLVGLQLRRLRRDFRAGVFGSRLKSRLLLMLSLMAVLPGALVYGVSMQFAVKSIDSWFDVRVDAALEGGLNLGRSVLDTACRPTC
jgi:nitrogen fixation/metabolism regulation signal transduction histidine kinase